MADEGRGAAGDGGRRPLGEHSSDGRGPGRGVTEAVPAHLQLLDQSPDCMKVIELDGSLRYLNAAGRVALGVPEEAPLGMSWADLLPEDRREAARAALQVAAGGAAATFPGRSQRPDGTVQHWDNHLSPLPGPDGRPTAVLCVSREVTAEREALARLEQGEVRLTTALRVGGMGVGDYDIVNDHMECDQQWYRIMGRDPEPPVRSTADFRPFIHPDDRDVATEVLPVATKLIASGDDYSIAFRVLRPDGEVRWVRSLAHLEEVDGVPVRAVGFIVDVSEALRDEQALREANQSLERERRQLSRQALEDPLTGVANRRHLDSELRRLWQAARTEGGALAVGLLDIDHFKEFNDCYGHLAGGEALRTIARALVAVSRRSDVIARCGGEEFGFLMPDVVDAGAIVDRYLAAVRDLDIVHEASPTGRLTISCGCVIWRGEGEDSPVTLLGHSDQALYEAKEAGRNRSVVRELSA